MNQNIIMSHNITPNEIFQCSTSIFHDTHLNAHFEEIRKSSTNNSFKIFIHPKHDFTHLGWVDGWLGRTLYPQWYWPQCACHCGHHAIPHSTSPMIGMVTPHSDKLNDCEWSSPLHANNLSPIYRISNGSWQHQVKVTNIECHWIIDNSMWISERI